LADVETDQRETVQDGPSELSETDLRIGRSLGLRTTQLGSAFEREHRDLLWRP